MSVVGKTTLQNESIRSSSRKSSIVNSHNRSQNGQDTPNHVSDQLGSPNEGTIQGNVPTASTPTHSNGRTSGSISNRPSGRRPWRDQPNIGKYKLIRTLGRGNFAKVKLAEHVSTGRQVAVKVIDKTQLNKASLQKLFREVKIMKMLNHPNIVRLYEVIESERHVYLVMEYASNGEVFDYLVTNGRMKEKEARAKFRQLVSAVEYCHCKKIVHRDLKAENLLLDQDFNIKLADFGFSNFYDGENKLDTFCGSPPYAAPELFQGQKYFGPEVDVWSLGVILYTLVSGSLPFDAQHLKELQSRVIRGKYRIPFYMSTDCELLLRKLLVLNPAKRKPLKAIMTDKWLNMGYEDSILEPYVEPPLNYNDPVRLAIMQKMGYQPEEVRDALERQSFNNVTAIYLLLADPKTQVNLPPQSFVRSARESKTDAFSPLHKSPVAENSKYSTQNVEILTTESTPSHSSKISNANNMTNNNSTKVEALNSSERKPGVSWLKQSSSAGPTSSRTGDTPTDNLSVALPHIQLSDAASSEAAGASGPMDNEVSTSTADASWIRRNNTFIAKKMRPSGSDTTPPDQSCPLSRAPQFSDIPNHLTSEANATPASSVSVADGDTEAFHPETWVKTDQPEGDIVRGTVTVESNISPESVTVATPYQRTHPFIRWLRRTFSCHRPRTKNSSSPVRTGPPPGRPPASEPSPVVRVGPNLPFTVVDMLDPEARHQFARNCPERATVAVSSSRHAGRTTAADATTGKHHLPLSERSFGHVPDPSSSASTVSRADTLNGSSTNTLISDNTRKCLNTPQTPKKAGEFAAVTELVSSVYADKSEPLEDGRNSPRLRLPTTTISPTVVSATSTIRDPMTQWSMRLRAVNPPEDPQVKEPQLIPTSNSSQTTSALPSNVAALMSNVKSSGTVPTRLTTAKPYTSTPTKSGHFFRRLTSRLSRSHGPADEVKRLDDSDSQPDQSIRCVAEAQSDASESRTGTRLATESTRSGSVVDLTGSMNPVDPWTARQRQRRPKSSAAADKRATIMTASLDRESPPSGTDGRNGYPGESADDPTLAMRDNEPFISRPRESRSVRFPSMLTGSLGRRRLPGFEADRTVANPDETAIYFGKPSKPRRLHFVYRMRVIGRDPNVLLKEAVRVLDQNSISYVYQNSFCLSCTNQLQPNRHSAIFPDSTPTPTVASGTNPVVSGEEEKDRLLDSELQNASTLKWEMEICRLGKPSRYGVKFKRISGDLDAFKQLELTLSRQFTIPPT